MADPGTPDDPTTLDGNDDARDTGDEPGGDDEHGPGPEPGAPVDDGDDRDVDDEADPDPLGWPDGVDRRLEPGTPSLENALFVLLGMLFVVLVWASLVR